MTKSSPCDGWDRVVARRARVGLMVGAPRVTVRGEHVRIEPSAEQQWGAAAFAAFGGLWVAAAALIDRSSGGLTSDKVAVGIALAVAVLSFLGATWMILRAGAVEWSAGTSPVVRIRWGMWPFVREVRCAADRLRARLAMVDGAPLQQPAASDTGTVALWLAPADGAGAPLPVVYWLRRREPLLAAARALREIMPVDDCTLTTVAAPDGTDLPVPHTAAAWAYSATTDSRLRQTGSRQWEAVPTRVRWTTSALVTGIGVAGVALLIGLRLSQPVERLAVFYTLLAVSGALGVAGLLMFAVRHDVRCDGMTISIRERNPFLLRRRLRTVAIEDVVAIQIAAWLSQAGEGVDRLYFELNLVLRPAGERINLLTSPDRAAIYEDARRLAEQFGRPLIDSTAAGRLTQQ